VTTYTSVSVFAALLREHGHEESAAELEAEAAGHPDVIVEIKNGEAHLIQCEAES
jgi:hypothetical protein